MPAGIGSTPSTVGREGAHDCARLVTRLLRRVGADVNDAANRAVALDALHDATMEFNAERNWVDRRLTTTITFTAGTGTYALPARYRESVGRAWLLDTSDDRTLVVEELAYEDFLQQVSDEGVGNSDPDVFTVVNRVDTGLLEVWPIPSSTTVTNYPKMELVYYADIPLCADSSGESLAVSGALEGAIFRLALSIVNVELGDGERQAAFEMNARNALRRAIGYDNQLRVHAGNLRGLY